MKVLLIILKYKTLVNVLCTIPPLQMHKHMHYILKPFTHRKDLNIHVLYIAP